ncbi:MAG: hypothetical protein RLZZ245_663, partial [Verrucomicrobiota bacterium]
FLSIHSTRDPGVCRNEVAMALQYFGKVYPVLVEKVPQESIPVTITHLQWPDLSRWREFRDQEDLDFERYYEEKLLEIVSRVEGDATRFASEAAILRRVLKPSSFEGKFAQHLEGFMGREWIFDAFEDWLNQQPDSRVFWLKAGPGFGKTALAVNLASRYRAAVVGTWFCDEQSIELRDPLRAVCTLAFQLALRWDDYRARLLPRLELFADSPEAQIAEALESLSKKNLADLFNLLISEPLAGLIWREHKLVILIDALDEATEATGQNALSALISGKFMELPKWISFVVTSRPDASVVGHLQRFKPFEIAAADARNTDDLTRYCAARIGGLPALAGLDVAQRDRICSGLVEKSEGMILYLRMVEEGLREGTLRLADLEKMQSGIGGLYSRYYQTFEHRFGCDFVTNVQPLLRLIMAAPGPLPLEMAAGILTVSKEEAKRRRSRLGGYLMDSAMGLSLFHKTLGEWLNSDTSGQFVTCPSSARKHLCDFLWDCFLRRRKDSHGITLPLDREEQVLEWLPNMLPEMTQWNQGDPLVEVAEWLREHQQWTATLVILKRALYQHVKILGEFHADTLMTRNRLGDLLRDFGDFRAAEVEYQRALEGCRKSLGQKHPITLECVKDVGQILADLGRYSDSEKILRLAWEGQTHVHGEEDIRTLEVVYALGSSLRRLGRLDEAEKMYVRALNGRTNLLGDLHPETLESLHGLALLHDDKDDSHKARELYLRALEGRERTLGPDHPATLRTVNNIGNLLKSEEDIAGAESLYRRALNAKERVLGTEHPSTLVSAFNLGRLLMEKRDIAGAESLCRRVLTAQERVLGAEHPHTLISMYTLADILKEKGEFEKAETLLRETLSRCEVALGREHPETLKSVYGLAEFLKAKGELRDAEALLREALSRCEIALGKDIPDTLRSVYRLAEFLKEKGEFEEAEILFRR